MYSRHVQCVQSVISILLFEWHTIAHWCGSIPMSRFIAHECCGVDCFKATIARVDGTALVDGGTVRSCAVIRCRWRATVLEMQYIIFNIGHRVRLITYLSINSSTFTLNKNEYGVSNTGHIKMVCQIRSF